MEYTAEQLTEYLGILIGAFILGFVASFLITAFKKGVEKIG